MKNIAEMEIKIFGYNWKDIQAMQNKTYRPVPIPIVASEPIPLTQKEMDLYHEIGIAGLEARGLYGIIDRIKRLKLEDDHDKHYSN